MKRIAVVAMLLFALLALVGCGSAVPGLKGLTLDEATRAISEAGFTPGSVTYDEAAGGAEGGVSSQTPEASKRVDQGTPVNIVIAGPPPVEVPSLSGLSLPEAKAVLAAVGLTAGAVDEQYSDSVARDDLVEQSPEASETVGRGSAVAMTFSQGPTPQSVPSVKGMAEKDALSKLKGAGFRAGVARSYSSKKKGTVIAQSPSDGTLQPGKIVKITVSKGPKASYSTGSASEPAPHIYSYFTPHGGRL